MPSESRSAKSFERKLRLLQLLPRAPRKIAASELRRRLRDEYDIVTTARTVERDLVDLSGMLPIASDADKGTKPYGWFWLAEANALDVPLMSPQAALTFQMAEQFLRELLPPAAIEHMSPHFRRARAVLGGLHREGLATWPEKVRVYGRGQPLLPPDTDPEVLDVVYSALLRDRCLHATYRSRGSDEARQRLVNPLGLVLRERIAYLACTLDGGVEVRCLRLHRMTAAWLANEERSVPAGFTLDGFVAAGGAGFRLGERSLAIELRVANNVLLTLQETPLSLDQQLERLDDGRTGVRATVADTLDLRGWIKSYGELIEVVGPAALRAELEGVAAELAGRYDVVARPLAKGAAQALAGAKEAGGEGA
jgi:predicted DNA-binding transcriptional regulator YafY